jgi:NAD/NADP transhydrogenase beta subunit
MESALQPSQELVYVHPEDSGIIRIGRSSSMKKYGTVAATIAVPPAAIYAAFTHELQARCETCGAVFATSRYARRLEGHMQLLVAERHILQRYESYDPEKRRAEIVAAHAEARRKDSAQSGAAQAIVWGVLALGCAIVTVTMHGPWNLARLLTFLLFAAVAILCARSLLRASRGAMTEFKGVVAQAIESAKEREAHRTSDINS